MPVARASANSSFPCAGAWGAVDARAIPLTFQITPEPGDPFPLMASLQIVPRLLGTTEQFTNPGGLSHMSLQLMMAVQVNGEQVSRDSLWGEFEVTDGADSVRPLSFPKGAANATVVSNVTVGSEVSITVWAYMRGNCLQPASVYPYSSYGDGPAIEILVRDATSVAVADEDAPQEGLWLSAHPNPSPGPSRIAYALPQASDVRLSIYDLAGHRVIDLVERLEDAGRHEVRWDGRSSRGERLAAGVYLMELLAGPQRTVGKLALLGQ